MRNKEHQLNQDAYTRLKDTIKSSYPFGRFVAIAGGQIVGDADEFMKLYDFLKASGRDPAQVMIIQAGHEYLEKAIIF
jgi:hypothetical protein